MKIGVFDSGVGGLSVARAIRLSNPDYEVIYKHDRQHVPYGSKPIKEIYGYVLPILESLEKAGCQIIVIACNTVTTNLINELRQIINLPLIGIEPMVKPACLLTKSKVIAVCATPATLKSDRYNYLKVQYAKSVKVLEPDCSDWSYMIENNQLDIQKLKQRIDWALARSADVIVLGCTHYHWIEQEIRSLVSNKAIVIQPEQAIIKQLWRVSEQLS
jgi:glutamate racemase